MVVAFGWMYYWRISLNGPCVTVFKTKGMSLLFLNWALLCVNRSLVCVNKSLLCGVWVHVLLEDWIKWAVCYDV